MLEKIKIIKNIYNEFSFEAATRLLVDYFNYRIGLHTKNIFSAVNINKKEVRYYNKKLEKIIYARKNTTDITLLIQFFGTEKDKEYDITFEENADNIEWILDCGANIGLFSLIYSKKYPEAKIISIEPEQENYDILVKNVLENEKIIPLKYGVWCKDSFLKVIPRDTGEWGFVVKECSEEDADVEGISINSLLKIYEINKIDIAKLDIEGSEYEVIMENAEWLKKTGIVIIEMHERFRPGSERKIEDELIQKQVFREGERNSENRIFYNTNSNFAHRF